MSDLTVEEYRDERRRITFLVRWLTGFIGWVAASTALVFLLDLEDHEIHFGAMVVVTVATVWLFLKAKAVALRFYPYEAEAELAQA